MNTFKSGRSTQEVGRNILKIWYPALRGEHVPLIGLFGARPGRPAPGFNSLMAFGNLAVRLEKGYIRCSTQEVGTWHWLLELGAGGNRKEISFEFYICIQSLSITKLPSRLSITKPT